MFKKKYKSLLIALLLPEFWQRIYQLFGEPSFCTPVLVHVSVIPPLNSSQLTHQHSKGTWSFPASAWANPGSSAHLGTRAKKQNIFPSLSSPLSQSLFFQVINMQKNVFVFPININC